MKNLVLATVFAATATATAATAFAGGIGELAMDAPVVALTMESAAGSSNGLLLQLALLALIAMVAN